MAIRKIGRALLFPRAWVIAVLVPISAVFLAYSMAFSGTDSVPAIMSYVLAAYTLTVCCFRIPRIIRFIKSFREENKYARRWRYDTALRVNMSLYGTLIYNTAYAAFCLWLGFYHHTFWYYSIAGYYISLAVMRFFLVRHTRKYKPGERLQTEFIKYRTCGFVFLVMNLALSLMIFFMVYWNRTFNHHEITAIAMAAYTFTSFTLAVVNIIKYRKFKSPVYSASKAISLASASVSMLTLESTMLTIWGDGENPMFRRIMLASTGAAVSIFVVVMAIYMIVQGYRGLKKLNRTKASH